MSATFFFIHALLSSLSILCLGRFSAHDARRQIQEQSHAQLLGSLHDLHHPSLVDTKFENFNHPTIAFEMLLLEMVRDSIGAVGARSNSPRPQSTRRNSVAKMRWVHGRGDDLREDPRMEPYLRGLLERGDKFKELLSASGESQLSSLEVQTVSDFFAKIEQLTYVAPSSRHGLGLFAKTDLESNTIVSFYPVDAVLTADNKRLVSRNESNAYFAKNKKSLTHRQLLSHEVSAEIDICADPEREDVAGFLAHRANDASSLKGRSKTDFVKYGTESIKGSNSIVAPFTNKLAPILALITMRNVSKDEELLVSYGPEFWASDDISSIPWQEVNYLYAPYLEAAFNGPGTPLYDAAERSRPVAEAAEKALLGIDTSQLDKQTDREKKKMQKKIKLKLSKANITTPEKKGFGKQTNSGPSLAFQQKAEKIRKIIEAEEKKEKEKKEREKKKEKEKKP